MRMDMPQEPFYAEISKDGEMPRPTTATPVLCEAAQSKCTWTCHKSHSARKFAEKMPDALDTTSNEHWP